MRDYHEEIREIKSLEKKLRDIFNRFEKQPSKVPDEFSDEEEKITVSISPIDFTLIFRGLIYLRQSVEAERYIKESIATGVTNEQRWSKVAEIMLLRDPNEKLSIHGDDELIFYAVMIKTGLTAKQASEEVFKKFKFNTLESCDKWLRREIEKYQKKQPSHWFCELPKPSTAPRSQ